MTRVNPDLTPVDGPLDDPMKLSSPAALRNLAPIQAVLSKVLPGSGVVLEVASGTGEHIVAHAQSFPHLFWQATDIDPARIASIEARIAEANKPNLHPVLELNACARGWGREQGPVNAIVVVNLLHLISDAEMAVLLDEAVAALSARGVLAIYGPFLRDGQTTSEGDAAFDAELRAQDPAIGYKELDVLASVLEAMQLRVTIHAMPANNVMVVAKRPAF